MLDPDLANPVLSDAFRSTTRSQLGNGVFIYWRVIAVDEPGLNLVPAVLRARDVPCHNDTDGTGEQLNFRFPQQLHEVRSVLGQDDDRAGIIYPVPSTAGWIVDQRIVP